MNENEEVVWLSIKKFKENFKHDNFRKSVLNC